MIIKEMFYIPIKLKPELARANNLTQIKFTTENSIIHIIHYSAIGETYCTFAVVRFTGMTLVRK
jgi:hypothetical protein